MSKIGKVYQTQKVYDDLTILSDRAQATLNCIWLVHDYVAGSMFSYASWLGLGP